MTHRRDIPRRDPGRHRQSGHGLTTTLIALALVVAIALVLALYLAI